MQGKDTMQQRIPISVMLFGAICAGTALAETDDLSSMRGANYVPSYARNDVAIWMDYDPAVVGRELGYAQKLRLNTVRVFLQQAVHEKQPEKFLADFESLLSLCDQHDIRLMPVLFDSCFDPQTVDLEDYRGKTWMPSPGFSRLGARDRPAMERYIRAVVGGHKDDRRVVLWDVMNEPESTGHYGDWERGGRQTIDEFVRWSLRRVKEEKPTQPLTIGWAGTESNIAAIDLVDVICIHLYGPPEELTPRIREAQHWGRLHGKPVIMNEFIGRPRQPFERAMPIVTERKIGWCFWELMIGRTQFSEGAYPYQGLLYPDGACLDAGEVAVVAGVSPEEARRLFPERPLPEVKDDGAVYRGFWTRWTGAGPLKDRLFYAVSPRSEVTFEYSGSKVTLIHKVGPDCGIAEILVDAKPAETRELDTYARDVEWNHRTTLGSGLAPGNHVVTIKVAARKNPASSSCLVQVVGFERE